VDEVLEILISDGLAITVPISAPPQFHAQRRRNAENDPGHVAAMALIVRQLVIDVWGDVHGPRGERIVFAVWELNAALSLAKISVLRFLVPMAAGNGHIHNPLRDGGSHHDL
jgi:hypothetical protein